MRQDLYSTKTAESKSVCRAHAQLRIQIPQCQLIIFFVLVSLWAFKSIIYWWQDVLIVFYTNGNLRT